VADRHVWITCAVVDFRLPPKWIGDALGLYWVLLYWEDSFTMSKERNAMRPREPSNER
jgi:hypothetical protein